MPDKIRILETMPLFENLSHKELEKIADLLHLVDVKKDEILTREDDLAREFYIILEGEYKITFKNGKFVTLKKRGDFIGWATIIAASRYMGTGSAVTNGQAFKLNGHDFMDLLVSDADIGNKIMANGSALAAKGKPFTQD